MDDALEDVLSALEFRVVGATSMVQLTQAARELDSLTANRIAMLRNRPGSPAVKKATKATEQAPKVAQAQAV